MSSVAIIGAQWGDEGKGKITDYLSQDIDCVVRFQGGNNAGHTIWHQGVKTVLHVIPSGIMHENCVSIIDHGVVLDPISLINEIDNLVSSGINVSSTRLMISQECSIITEYHKLLDKVREGEGSGKIGTTKKGIGPTYEDKMARKSLKLHDLFNKEKLKEKLEGILEEKRSLFENLYETEVPDIDKVVETLFDAGMKIQSYSANLYEYFALNTKRNILFEGAQGVLLDVDFGSYPFVTSSSTSYGGIFTGSSRTDQNIDEVIGITKAYCTRVGEGPFPTELAQDNHIGKTLLLEGKEYGATTGRKRRCGWLDLPLLKYSAKVSRFTSLALTKVDILNFINELKVCYAYELDGKIIDFAYPGIDLEKATPLYREFQPIKHEIKDNNLPISLKTYVDFIEREVGIPVKFIAYGPDRSELLVRES